MIFSPVTNEGYKLFHEGMQALSQVEANGIRIDTEYLCRAKAECKAKIAKLKDALLADDVYTKWRRRFGQDTNLGSREQLGEVVFGIMKHPCKAHTPSGRFSTDDEALRSIKLPFVQQYLEAERWKKALNTYIKGIERETVDGYLHPFFNLHLVSTFRSCVAEGTLIEVVRNVSKHPKGIPIEQVKKGDYAYCYDDQRRLVLRKVLWAGKTGHREVIRIHWLARGKHGYLDVTPEHRIRMVDGSYRRADYLVKGQDFRTEADSPHSPKIRVLSLGRVGNRIWPTGYPEIIDHRFVYEQINGIQLSKKVVVHHKDRQHLNNIPSNLQRKTKSTHAKLHAPEVFTDEARKKALQHRMKNHRLYGDRWPTGSDTYKWVELSKWSFLHLLAEASGQITKTPHDFGVMKHKAELLGIDLDKVRDRYDNNGVYISRGRLLRLSMRGRSVAQRELHVNFYKLKRLYQDRGLSTERRWGNQFGSFIPHNHKILDVEWTGRVVDVYDIEVEECHNFIANEICIHNSSDSPNFQNIPIRRPEIAKLIRTAFIPRSPNRRIVEYDFKGIEVGVSACYNHDPVLIEYVSDPTKDMHGDMGRQCYIVTRKQTTKLIRYATKNGFVFPEFYGNWYKAVAKDLWTKITELKLTTANDVPLKKHLRKQGITGLGKCDLEEDAVPGTFEYHIKEVEEDFWGRRFKVYSQWKRDWNDAYLEKGYFDTLTGFRCSAMMDRKQCVNFPIQGSAFHCLLWSLIRVQKLLQKYNMKSLIIGQIHDSMIMDVLVREMKDVMDIVKQVTMMDLAKHWKWIIVPMRIEAEAAPPGKSWYVKEEIRL